MLWCTGELDCARVLSAHGRRFLRGSNVFRAAAAACLLLACEPDVQVGSWSCPWPARLEEGDDPRKLTPVTEPQSVPWRTSFETGLCDYNRALGYCYHATNARFEVVDDVSGAPVHSGRKSMAFSIAPADSSGQQTRCVLEGAPPVHAVYSAYFYLPQWAETKGNWNLIYFPGGPDLKGLWDVSLHNRDDKDADNVDAKPEDKRPLQLHLFEHRTTKSTNPSSKTTVPIGRWFQVEVRILRAADETGEIELRQDGETLVLLKGVITDISKRGQWYVGNLADGLVDVPESTIYVDDVSVRPVP